MFDLHDGPCIHACPALWQGASPTLGKGSKPPRVNKKAEQMQMKLMQAQLRQAGQKIEMPHMAAMQEATPAPPPPPPPTSSSIDIQEAQTDARRQALKRSGYQSTLFAGETGGANKSALGGQQTLLG